jgi:hypothetical protein
MQVVADGEAGGAGPAENLAASDAVASFSSIADTCAYSVCGPICL